MKVLVVKPTALGDVAQALKVVPWLKRSGRFTQLDWVIDTDYLPILEICPDIDHCIGFPRKLWSRRFCAMDMLNWTRVLRKESYDAVLDLQGLARSALMTRLARSARRVGLASSREGASWAYSEIVPDDQQHAVDRYAAAVGHLLDEKKPHPLLTFPAPDTPLPPGIQPGQYTVFHPYSLWATKLWPWERFVQLAAALPNEPIVWVGSGPFFPVKKSSGMDLRGKTPLPLLLTLLANARAVVSTDSGPAHLAALFGVPVISLFGATDPSRTSPRSERGEVLHAEGLACRPCLKRNCGWSKPMACLHQVSVDQVVSAWHHQMTAG
jgi:heptosyltransferase I